MGTIVPIAGSQRDTLLTSPARLRKVDLLRDKNLGEYVPLPQLVAVGDQSSGKSSLLESLTGIPFPRGQELCTRYATQITHRRDSNTFINIGIIPASSASDDETTLLKAYEKSIQTTFELQKQLPGILAEVNKIMGIRTTQNPKGTKTFSENVLKIEKCGPTEDYLTVIDVPGIFRITTDNITTQTDKSLVLNMVQNYIRNDNTIILAVLPCNVDIVTQEILEMAEKYDPAGQRTLGVLTKPDLVRERSAQSVVCNLIDGKKRPLNLGYHLVRSRGGDDDRTAFTDEERDSMFKEEPWCHLHPDRLGVLALRRRLQQLLGELIDRAFPKLRAKTRELLTQARNDLEKLGQSRQTEREQQQYLISIASEFQDIVRPALKADYSFSEVFDIDDFRLITTVLNLTDEFKTAFTATAHTYQFLERGQNSDEESKCDEDAQSSSSSEFGEDVPLDRFPDLDAIISRELDASPPLKGIMDWIRKAHRRSRGSELTSYNASLFASALRQQTSKWQVLTEFFVSKIVYKIHAFIVSALGVVCSDTKVREELLSHMLEAILGRYDAAMNQVRLLVEVERGGQPYTLNNAFREALSNLQIARTEQELSPKLKSVDFIDKDRRGRAISLADVQATLRDKNGGKYIAEDVHDLIKSYYEVARDRFIDNVYLQVVAHCLVSGSNSPLRLFCEKWVLNLEPEYLEAIAGESFQTRMERERLAKTIDDLKEAAAILR